MHSGSDDMPTNHASDKESRQEKDHPTVQGRFLMVMVPTQPQCEEPIIAVAENPARQIVSTPDSRNKVLTPPRKQSVSREDLVKKSNCGKLRQEIPPGGMSRLPSNARTTHCDMSAAAAMLQLRPDYTAPSGGVGHTTSKTSGMGDPRNSRFLTGGMSRLPSNARTTHCDMSAAAAMLQLRPDYAAPSGGVGHTTSKTSGMGDPRNSIFLTGGTSRLPTNARTTPCDMSAAAAMLQLSLDYATPRGGVDHTTSKTSGTGDPRNSRFLSGLGWSFSNFCLPCLPPSLRWPEEQQHSKQRPWSQQQQAAIQQRFAGATASAMFGDSRFADRPIAKAVRRIGSNPTETVSLSEEGKFVPTPMCCYRCDLFLMSHNHFDEPLLPRLSAHLRLPINALGKDEFLVCTSRPFSSGIYQRLEEIPPCKDGISLIIVAFGLATSQLRIALEENTYRDSLKPDGMAEEVYEMLETVKPRMAVFALWPVTYIGWNSAKIVVNIDRSQQKTLQSGRLQTRAVNGKVVNKIVFHDESGDNTLQAYLNNAEIIKFMRGALCKEFQVETCRSVHPDEPPRPPLDETFGIWKARPKSYCSTQ